MCVPHGEVIVGQVLLEPGQLACAIQDSRCSVRNHGRRCWPSSQVPIIEYSRLSMSLGKSLKTWTRNAATESVDTAHPYHPSVM